MGRDVGAKENMKAWIRSSYGYRVLCWFRECAGWRQRNYAAPSPHFIKQSRLIANGFPGATWVETGTFLGHTTQLLSGHGAFVYSIEPEPSLFANAKKRFASYANVEILNGTSEAVFPDLLPRIEGNVNFWLDGHYSGGITFQGASDTPIIDELRVISDNLGHFKDVCVLVDDIRCFDPHLPEFATYPSLDVLVDWARRHDMRWHIEHDIFVARTRSAG